MTDYRVLSQLTLDAVAAEAIRAHNKHKDRGGSILDPSLPTLDKLAALGEEYGEVCRELTYDNKAYRREHLVKELIQLANVALTWAEALESPSTWQRLMNVTSSGLPADYADSAE